MLGKLTGRVPCLKRLREHLMDLFCQASYFLMLIRCHVLYLCIGSLNGIFASDRVLIPISADYLALSGALAVERTLRALERVLKKPPLRRFVLTRFDTRRNMSWKIDRKLREHFGAELCETRISENVSLAESPGLNLDVFAHAPNSRGARDYAALLEELEVAGFLS